MRRLFWDIETSPNLLAAFRVGHKVSVGYQSIFEERGIICLCWKWQGEKAVHHLQWDGNQDDRQLLEEFQPIIDSADEVVAHNGDHYDIKFMNTRMAAWGIKPRQEHKTIDTLAWARRKFYFNSNRLDYIAKFFGYEGKIHTDFDLWKCIKLKRCDKCMRKMVRYCKQDVRVLEWVYNHLEPFNKPKSHAGVMKGRPKTSCPRCGHERSIITQHRTTASGTKRVSLQCKGCGGFFSMPQLEYDKLTREVAMD